MAEVTRIACPGCRSLLRFEPEALDFPANCGACECRFTAGIYLRTTCPNCHSGSKIRESFRGRQVRCVRCRHDFLADDGILPGGGGRLLVARMLDTGLLEPPETIQPFLGHVREDVEARRVAPEDERIRQADRVKARLIADRERLAEEFAELAADRDRRLEELAEARRLLDGAIERAKSAEEKARAMLDDHVEAIGAADRERSALLTTVDRLNRAIQSAKAGEEEALDRLDEFARKLQEAEASLEFERQRTLELQKNADLAQLDRGRLEAEEDARLAREKAARAAEERDAAAELVERTRARLVEVEAKQRTELGGLAVLLAERENARLAALEENKTLAAQLERLRADMGVPQAENDRLAEAVDQLLEQNQQLLEAADRLQAENRRLADDLETARSSPLAAQGPADPDEIKAVKAEAERRQKALVGEIQRVKAEYQKLVLSRNAEDAAPSTPASTPAAAIIPDQPANGLPVISRDDVPSLMEPFLTMGFASTSGVWESPGSIDSSSVVPNEAEAREQQTKEVDLHRDLAVTLLYGENSDDGESSASG